MIPLILVPTAVSVVVLVVLAAAVRVVAGPVVEVGRARVDGLGWQGARAGLAHQLVPLAGLATAVGQAGGRLALGPAEPITKRRKINFID